MATQTRAQSRPGAKGERRRATSRQAQPNRSVWSRLSSGAGRIRGVWPELTVSSRLRREIVGAGLLLFALLTAWTLGRGESDGRVIAWLANVLVLLFGSGAPLVPVLVGLVAARAFRNSSEALLRPRHYLGGAAFVGGVLGLLQLAEAGAHANDGGYVGLAVATPLRGAIGEIGAGLALYIIGTIGVFLLADTDVLSFYNELRRLAGRAQPPLTEEAPAEPELPRRAAKRERPSVPVEPKSPVINLPAREAARVEPADVPPPLAMVDEGEPLPLPDLSMLALYDGVTVDAGDLEGKARLIEETLHNFKVDARVREINPGPAVTQFAIEPGVGVKVRRITELQNDLALALAAPSIRIEAPIPGMARVGLEIPNSEVARVGLRETLESAAFGRSKAKLPLPLGRDVNGRYVFGDLARMPHLLIAGATGSGKSVCLNAFISTFLLTRRPSDVRLLMIDPKMVELTGYNGVPHLQAPVVTEMDKVVGALRLVLREMERRYALFSRLGVRNIDGYRMKIADEPNAEPLPYLVVIIDELADLMMTAPDDVETVLVRLAQMARATGIHLIIATQRPSVDVLTGLIKANVPARIAFAVTSSIDSRVVLDMPGAERLLGRGDMLFLPPDAAKPQRIQGAFIDDADVPKIVDHWHQVSPIPQYAKEWLDLPSSSEADESGEDDPLMDQALDIVRQQGTASASMLQRRLRVGYNRAARLIERMEDEGIIGPADGIRGRPVLMGDE